MPTALIVDDNGDNRYLLECILSAKGFDVISAANGLEALSRAENSLPDLVLSDILMPVMDGFSFCRQWKQSQRFKAIPFVFYTATYTDPKDEEFALSLGADLFIVKPADPDELVRLVQSVLERRAAGQLLTLADGPNDETPYLRQYNEVLIRKLEDKLLQVEKANQGLLVKDFAIASSRAGIAIADLDGCINYANAAFSRLWSKGNESLLGRDLEVLFPDALQRAQALVQVQNAKHWVGQISGCDCNGSNFIALVEIHAVVGPQDMPLCFMISCSDITEQERMRKELQRAQRLDSLSHFAAGIAHDFNNLLTAIFAGLNLAEPQLNSRGEASDQQAFIASAFQRAKDLTQRLLSFGKGGNLPRQTLNVRALIKESCQLALTGSSTRVQLELPETLWNVHANATELSQVFCNIIINARQAMQDAGALRITAANCSIEATDGTGLNPGNYVTLQFCDSGPGMDAPLLERIFEPFFTSKPQGTGLGLAMSHSIVSSLGGRITAHSSPGVGATFQIWLPASSERVESLIPPATPNADIGSGSILVLDDDEQVCWITSRLLQKQGYRVVTATRGEQAIELYRDALSEKKLFDLIILDLTVRDGLGGEATLEQLRKMDPQVVALACSGYTDEATLLRVTQLGFVGMLRKPYLAHELYSIVKATMASNAQDPG